MHTDFALRQNPKYHNAAITNIFHHVYMKQDDQHHTKPLPGPPGHSVFNTYHGGTSAPILKARPDHRGLGDSRPKEIFVQGKKPQIDYSSYQNPPWRQKYKLPKKQPNSYSNPRDWSHQYSVQFVDAPHNPEMPQDHILFKK